MQYVVHQGNKPVGSMQAGEMRRTRRILRIAESLCLAANDKLAGVATFRCILLRTDGAHDVDLCC